MRIAYAEDMRRYAAYDICHSPWYMRFETESLMGLRKYISYLHSFIFAPLSLATQTECAPHNDIANNFNVAGQRGWPKSFVRQKITQDSYAQAMRQPCASIHGAKTPRISSLSPCSSKKHPIKSRVSI